MAYSIIVIHDVCTFICTYVHSVVTITTPPEDTTVCRGSDVTISCGYDSNTPLNVVWRINGTAHLTQSQIMNISSYQLNNPTTPVNYSLTIFSINGTTIIRCSVASQSSNIIPALSPIVTITVIGMYIMYVDYIICEQLPVWFKYFTGQNCGKMVSVF